MKTALEEARRIAGGIARQRQDVEVRRAALATIQQMDIVQVVGGDGRLYPPSMVWVVEDGPVYLLADWAKDVAEEEGWAYHERRFSADGREIDGDRVLVVPNPTPKQAHEVRKAQFSRWTRALDDRERAFDASLPGWLRAVLPGKWLEEALREETPQEIECRAAAQIDAAMEPARRAAIGREARIRASADAEYAEHDRKLMGGT